MDLRVFEKRDVSVVRRQPDCMVDRERQGRQTSDDAYLADVASPARAPARRRACQADTLRPHLGTKVTLSRELQPDRELGRAARPTIGQAQKQLPQSQAGGNLLEGHDRADLH